MKQIALFIALFVACVSTVNAQSINLIHGTKMIPLLPAKYARCLLKAVSWILIQLEKTM